MKTCFLIENQHRLHELSTFHSLSWNMRLACKLYIHVAYLLRIPRYNYESWTLLCTRVKEEKWGIEGGKKSDTVSYIHPAEQSAAAEHMLWHHSASILDWWWWHAQSLLVAVSRWKTAKTGYQEKWVFLTLIHASYQPNWEIEIWSITITCIHVKYLTWKYVPLPTNIAGNVSRCWTLFNCRFLLHFFI